MVRIVCPAFFRALLHYCCFPVGLVRATTRRDSHHHFFFRTRPTHYFPLRSSFQHPLLLKGHTRPLTFLKYNKEGDLLFSCAKDSKPTLWYSDDGERVGTYDGHTGAVWACDVTDDSKVLLTASADMSVKMWNVETGEEICTIPHAGPVRSVEFSEGQKFFATATAPFQALGATIKIFAFDPDNQSMEPVLTIDDTKCPPAIRIQQLRWSAVNKYIVAGCEDGVLRIYDPKTGDVVKQIDAHTKCIMNMQWNAEKTLMVTASKDCLAKLYDADTWEHLKTYETDRPINSAMISPLKLHVVTGGGQEAMSVTTTASMAGKFEARFFHMVYEDIFGLVKGHFGPINFLAFQPNGKSYCSGGEDGYIRLHHFDESYLTMDDGREAAKRAPAAAAAGDEGESKRA